jgi:hypothetical protein
MKRSGGKAFLGVLVGLFLFSTVGLGIVSYKHYSDKNILSRKISETEGRLENFFYEGYEKGYQSAIIDAYLENPSYMVLEDEDGVGTLWKRVEVDEVNKKRLESVKAGETEQDPDPQTDAIGDEGGA